MNGCFVLYPFKLGEALTKRINVGISTDNSFGCELAENVVCMEDIPPYDVSLRDGWAICSSEGNHTLTGEPLKTGSSLLVTKKRRLLDKYRRISSDRSRCCCIGLGSAGTGFCCRCVSLRERTSERNGVDQGLSNPEKRHRPRRRGAGSAL